MKRVLVATSNPGKIRDLIGAAAAHNVQIEMLPGFAAAAPVVEDGETFEANAQKKAEFYSKHAEGEIVIADDSAWRWMPGLCAGSSLGSLRRRRAQSRRGLRQFR